MLEQEISYLYEKVITKAKYNKLNQRYIIRESDYKHLNLSNKQMKLLKKMCQNSGIILEYHNEHISLLEDQELFELYNEIKTRLSSNPSSEEISSLEEKRIEIRNKIVNQNIETLILLINKSISGIYEMEDKSDIYQLGYELLIDFIDEQDILYKGILTRRFQNLLNIYITRKIITERTGLTKYTIDLLEKIKQARNKLAKGSEYVSPEQLSKESNIKEERIQELLNLERLLEAISIDEEISSQEELSDTSPLYDDTFEIQQFKKIEQDITLKIVYTLPKSYTEFLILYFGLDDQIPHKIIELAKMYGVSKTRISYIIKKIINVIKFSFREEILSEIYNGTEQSAIFITHYQLEEQLIRCLPDIKLQHYLNQLSQIEREVFTLFNGINQEREYTIDEIAKLLGIKTSKVYKIRVSALESIKELIKKDLKINTDYINTDYINTDYINYLMNQYLQTDLNKIKSRKKLKLPN